MPKAKLFQNLSSEKFVMLYRSMEGILVYHKLDKTKQTKYMQNVNNKTACCDKNKNINSA